jgi:hypothetical protein
MVDFDLIDEKFQIEFKYFIEVADFKLMSKLVKWCDSYTRSGILYFNFLKDFTNFAIFMERDNQLTEYIRRIRVYVRKPSHRLEWEDQKIAQFKDFILTEFKKAEPEVQEWSLNNEKDEVQKNKCNDLQKND